MEDLNEQLIKAIKTNDIGLVKQLIKAGADVNKANYIAYHKSKKAYKK